MEAILNEHAEYVARQRMYRQYRDLYVGGEQIKDHASEYLVRRQKEPMEVYQERLSRVFYENYIGSIVDWFAATLFRREPVMNLEGHDASSRAFFSAFTDDCDTRNTSVTDFFRKQFTDALVFGAAYTLVDFPKVRAQVSNRAEEDAVGRSRAYLVGYTPEHLINWEHDTRGRFEWVVLRSTRVKRDPAGELPVQEVTWVYYDRQSYRIYRAETTNGEQGPLEAIDAGQHGLAALDMVPLFELRPPEGLWLMNKGGCLQLEHFNKSNALAWAITMGLFATPVIYSDRPWDKVLGESYFIQLSPEDRFGWTEPEGRVFDIAARNLARLQQEIYRICYLVSQGGPSDASAAQSGLSKLRDYAITQEVLRAYGDLVKDSMKRVLRAIATARQDQLEIGVSGLDEFDIADFRTDLEDAERLISLGIPSPTLRKQIHKRLAHKYLCDVRQDVKDRIAAEIEAGTSDR